MTKISTDFITLQQFLKLAGLASTGGEAKSLIQNGEVLVNHQIETHRGKKLRPGDEVETNGKTVQVEG